MKIFKIVSAFVMISLLSGCFMERPTIERGYNVVYSQNDFFFFDEDGGMSDRTLPSGKQELSSGYNTAYYIPTTQQNFSFGKVSILMKERVGRTFEIDFGYSVKKGSSLKLVLNYLPQKSAKSVSTDFIGVDKIYLDLESVFQTNIRPFAEQVTMDIIDNESLYSVNTEQLSKIIDRKLEGILSDVQILERIVDENGDIVLSGKTMSIVDVIDINSINIVPGEMPKIVKNEVSALNDLQADLKSLKEDLNIETTIKNDELQNSAANIKAENDELLTLLKNDKFVKYQKLQQLKGIVETKFNSDGVQETSKTQTKILFYQSKMSIEEVADLVRATQ